MTALLDIATCINQNLAAIVPNQELDGHFLHYALTGFYKSIRRYARGGNQGALNCEIVSSLRIPFPSLEEQKKIVDRLDESLRYTVILEQNTQGQIDLIREYRTRLIADVVTGKLDVRDLAPALGDEITADEDWNENIDDEEMLGDEEPELVEDPADADG